MQINFLKSLANVSGMTLISRVLGLIRDILFAQYFGSSYFTDAFVVAFRLPNLLRRIFAEGAFSQAFVPLLAEYKYKETFYATKDFILRVAGSLIVILSIITIIGIIFSGYIIAITAPGFSADLEKFTLTVTLLKITFPYILFISIASLVGSILNSWGLFSIPAFTPTILNITFIFFMVFLRNYFHPEILSQAYAVFFGGILQLLFQLPYLKTLGLLKLPRFYLKDKVVLRVIKLMLPAIFAMSIAQISIVINNVFASFLPSGSISWINYADRLMEFPTGVLGVALGTILLPNLSKYASENNVELFSKTMDWGIQICLILALPATIGLALISHELTMALFMRGKFTMYDVIMTQKALIAYAIGLLGLILVKVFAPGFYAHKNVKTPVKIAIIVLILTQIMNLIFIGPFKHAGLALAIGIGACINASCLLFFLIKHNIYITRIKWKKFISKIIIAIIIMTISVIFSLKYLPFNFGGANYLRFLSLSSIVLIAVMSYFFSLFLLGLRLKHFKLHL